LNQKSNHPYLGVGLRTWEMEHWNAMLSAHVLDTRLDSILFYKWERGGEFFFPQFFPPAGGPFKGGGVKVG